MEQLDMCKAMADLECVDAHIAMEDKPDAYVYSELLGMEYNPITDLALNCAARDKYEVEINYFDKEVDIYEIADIGMILIAKAEFNGNVNQAVIECILKSKGKWV